MGRPREFDRGEALQKAVEVFWEKGYEGTSIQDLVDHMGIHRASLYDTYGNKQKLFSEAMTRYSAIEDQETFSKLEAAQPFREVLTNFFESLVDRLCEPEDKGCLMIKVAMSNGSSNGTTGQQVAEHFKMVDGTLRSFLARGQEQGQIRLDTDIDSLAEYLQSSLQGLFVSAAAGKDRESLMQIARWTISAVS